MTTDTRPERPVIEDPEKFLDGILVRAAEVRAKLHAGDYANALRFQADEACVRPTPVEPPAPTVAPPPAAPLSPPRSHRRTGPSTRQRKPRVSRAQKICIAIALFTQLLLLFASGSTAVSLELRHWLSAQHSLGFVIFLQLAAAVLWIGVVLRFIYPAKESAHGRRA